MLPCCPCCRASPRASKATVAAASGAALVIHTPLLPHSARTPQRSADFMHVVDVESFTLPCSPGPGAALAHPRLQQLPPLVKLPLTPSLPLPQSRVRALQRSPHASAAGPAKQVMFGFLSDSLMLPSQPCCCLQIMTGRWACLSSALLPLWTQAWCLGSYSDSANVAGLLSASCVCVCRDSSTSERRRHSRHG